MAQDYLPALLAILFGVGFACLFLVLAKALGPKHVTAEKAAPFECGSEPIGSPRVRFSVKFYVVAILFLVFDVESALLYPWAVQFRAASTAGGQTSLSAFIEMLLFLSILVVALIYVWRKKAVGWD